MQLRLSWTRRKKTLPRPASGEAATSQKGEQSRSPTADGNPSEEEDEEGDDSSSGESGSKEDNVLAPAEAPPDKAAVEAAPGKAPVKVKKAAKERKLPGKECYPDTQAVQAANQSGRHKGQEKSEASAAPAADSASSSAAAVRREMAVALLTVAMREGMAEL